MNPNPNPSADNPIPAFVPPAPPVYVPRPPKAVFDLNRRDRIFAGLLFALSLLGLSPAIAGGFYAAFGVSFALLFLLCSIYLYKKNVRLSAFSWFCGVPAFLCAPVFFLTSGAAIRLLTACGAAVLSVVWFASLAGKPIFPDELGLAERVLRTAGQCFTYVPRSIRAVCTGGKRSKTLLGLLCALPVLCVVLTLLARSDAAFEGLTQHLFVDAGKAFSRILLAVILFPFLLALGFSLAKAPDTDRPEKTKKGLDTGFIAAFLGLLSAAYLVYLFSQLAYFVSAFSGILPEGYTFSYAEYARRGFFELCGIAAINLTLLYLTLLLSRQKDGKLPAVLRALGTFIGVFTLFLICTAMAKMILYIRQFGATVLRLGTSAFMLFIAVVFLTLLVRFFAAKVRVLPVAAVTAAVILLVLGLGNLPAFCARYNYTHYLSGDLSTVDAAYLRRLGDEGIPYLLLLQNDQKEDVRKDACIQLYIAVRERYEGENIQIDDAPEPTDEDDIPVVETYFEPDGRKFSGIYSMNLPRKRAYDALDKLLRDEPDFMRSHAEAENALWDEYNPFW